MTVCRAGVLPYILIALLSKVMIDILFDNVCRAGARGAYPAYILIALLSKVMIDNIV